MMARCEKSKSFRSKKAQYKTETTARDISAKLKLALAAVILAVAFSINSYLVIRASLPAPIDYGAVYDALHAQ